MKKLILIFLFLFSFICNADKNIETKTELGFMINGGNTENINLTEKGKYNFIIKDFNKIKIENLFVLTKEKDKEFFDELSIMAKYAPLFSKIYYPEIGFEYYRNDFKDIQYRDKIIFGFTFDSVFETGFAYIFEIEQFKQQKRNYNNLLMGFFNLDYSYFDNFKILFDFKMYKKLSDKGIRLKISPSLLIHIIKKLDFKISLIYRYENKVPVYKKKYDYSILNSIVLSI